MQLAILELNSYKLQLGEYKDAKHNHKGNWGLSAGSTKQRPPLSYPVNCQE